MHEGDFLDWLSVAAVFAAALAAAIHAIHVSRRRRRFALLAAILAFLSIDDALGLHERVTADLAAALGLGRHGDVLFLLPYFPLLLAAFLFVWTAARESHGAARWTLSCGLMLLVAALGIRAIAALVSLEDIRLAGWQRTLGLEALHDAELLAWVLVAAGLVLLSRLQQPLATHGANRLSVR